MMVDPDAWEDRIELLFSQLSELHTAWADREQKMVAPNAGAVCMLRVTSSEALGSDEERYSDIGGTFDPDTSTCQVGNRVLTLNVMVDSWSNDARTRARTLLERIRTRLRRPSARASLDRIDTSIASVGPITAVGRIEDEREFARASMDIRLNTIAVELDSPIGSIGTIEISGSVKDADSSVKAMSAFTVDLPDP